MTYTYSTTESFTLTSAKHVASKVAADLRYMQALYGSPSNEWIQKYHDELVELLVGGYVDTVTYGFKRDEKWVAAIRYVADLNGNLTADERAGKLTYNVDAAGLSATSYLTYSKKWLLDLTEAQRNAIKSKLPFQRVTANEPGTDGGYWADDRTYSHDGGGVRRSMLRRYGS
jgi:hypothetical protein